MRIIKYIVPYILTLLCINNAKADYGNISLSALICDADYGAIGTIIKIDKNYFYLKVEEYVLNQLEQDTIAIVKFEDWSCAMRYENYKVGQRELVFFRKSNYVIPDFEFLGYGAGDEFELPIYGDTIKYQSGYHGRFESYNLKEFVSALKDYSKIKESVQGTSNAISKKTQIEFSARSLLHKKFIECKSGQPIKDFEISKAGNIVNLEKNFLYEDYENKLQINTANNKEIFLSVEDAEVRKENEYYIVKPKSGWARRWLTVYTTNVKNEKVLVFEKIFKVLELPDPSIYFGNSIKDTILFYSGRQAIPSVAYYLDWLHKDDNLVYKLLSYDYVISSGAKMETFNCKSEYGTKELYERVKKIADGDIIILKNIFVQYPNGKVKSLPDRKVVMKK